jgi:hypothetical protein
VDQAPVSAQIERELVKVNRNRTALVAAVARGEDLLDALRACEARRRQLEADLEAICRQGGQPAPDAAIVRSELLALASDWRRVLVDDPTHARPIVASLLQGRVTFTPQAERGRWELRGEGTLQGLFGGAILPKGGSSPTGLDTFQSSHLPDCSGLPESGVN